MHHHLVGSLLENKAFTVDKVELRWKVLTVFDFLGPGRAEIYFTYGQSAPPLLSPSSLCLPWADTCAAYSTA